MTVTFGYLCINRIRLEFKESIKCLKNIEKTVLIESDWNLKSFTLPSWSVFSVVLIESDWNLKILCSTFILTLSISINRIRLEFKVNANAMMDQSNAVLIESDWNLKDWMQDGEQRTTPRINRIRLEFKGISFQQLIHSLS